MIKGYGKQAQIPPLPSQLHIAQSVIPSACLENSRILYEGGSEKDEKTYLGWFCIQVFRKGKFFFNDGRFIEKR